MGGLKAANRVGYGNIFICSLLLILIFLVSWPSLRHTPYQVNVVFENGGFNRAVADLPLKPVVKSEDPKPKDDGNLKVSDTGFWDGTETAKKKHSFDTKLAAALAEFFKKEGANTILELGAGMGNYAKLFKAEGFLISCYDGNPSTQELSEGRCGMVDLSKPLDFSMFDWTMSLEVGEHIPQEFEQTFIDNLVRSSKEGVLVSWGVVGQEGVSHVNNRNNDYIKKQFQDRGFTSDVEVEKSLRAASEKYWFKKTIMVFRKDKTT